MTASLQRENAKITRKRESEKTVGVELPNYSSQLFAKKRVCD
jgi:hypothetical protein